MNQARKWHRGVDWRWRSIGRWRRQVATWWPGLSASADGFLAGLHRRAGKADRCALVEAAIASHVRWAAAM